MQKYSIKVVYLEGKVYKFKSRMSRPYLLLLIILTGFVCKGQDTLKSNLNKYYPVNQLRSDFVFFRTVLEKAHPGLYHYWPKDSVDNYFEQAQTNWTTP